MWKNEDPAVRDWTFSDLKDEIIPVSAKVMGIGSYYVVCVNDHSIGLRQSFEEATNFAMDEIERLLKKALKKIESVREVSE